MSQAACDPLFYACLAIAEQDAPGSSDLCIRCHTPQGWLEGRSVPTDGSALNVSDREGVTCDFCHKMVKPGGSWSVKTSPTTSVTLTGLISGRIYEYQVRTVCDGSTSNWFPEPPEQFSLANAFVGGLNVSGNSTISIYPNPATHLLNVEMNWVIDEEYQIIVVDKYGRQVKNLRKEAGPSFTISVKDLPPGIYFLSVRSKADQLLIRKFVVQPW